MTLKQLDKMADELADKYGLSPQLTLAWLRDSKLPLQKFSHITLAPEQLADLIVFAKV